MDRKTRKVRRDFNIALLTFGTAALVLLTTCVKKVNEYVEQPRDAPSFITDDKIPEFIMRVPRPHEVTPMTSEWRQWFRIDRAWVERREAEMRAWEDAIIRAARDRATGEERVLFDALLEERARNAGAPRRP